MEYWLATAHEQSPDMELHGSCVSLPFFLNSLPFCSIYLASSMARTAVFPWCLLAASLYW